MIYRAFVRGKVESFRLLEKELSHIAIAEITEKAIKYFRLARGYIERQALNSTLFIACGLMGSGKTTLAEQFAFELGISYFSSDKVRKVIAGINYTTNDKSSFKEGLYTDDRTTETYNELLKLAENEIKKNHSVIIDACFTTIKFRVLFSELAKKYSIPFVILYVFCSDNDIKRRLNERVFNEKTVSDGRMELLCFQEAEFTPPSEQEGRIIMINTSSPHNSLLNMIYKKIN